MTHRRGSGDYARAAAFVQQGSEQRRQLATQVRARHPQQQLPSPTVSVSSGSEIEWPQLGIGFGFGILLVAGLWLTMRMTKGRPLAH